MIIKAHAKINLAINVVGKKEDGYHDLDMVMVPVELHDSIHIEVLPSNFETYVTCDDFSLEVNEYNLCSITIRKMKEKYNINKSFRVHIHKNIPIGAGLGGGSSNAAAVINAIKTLLKLDIPYEEEIELAKSIGADVPFFLKNNPARVEGIGEKLTPIKIKNKYYVLLIKPKNGLSTKDVYAKYDEVGSDNHADVDSLIKALENGDELKEFMGNDLEKASITMLPVIQDIKKLLLDDGFENVLMSGSGSSVFAISTNRTMVEKEYRKLEKMGLNVYLTKVI
ncbi:MAG: 4-(cytidine 5'-diphospho)-2-C-methyl-D-erythritol kinase [Erysipelotrichales bacterium]|nr:4-(cytidine 5'-diphospho)-2-C-methyl-D-erythritol kinase [Erysipelotrichales bacterium]